ncbi:MAG: hypothetical protein AAFU79_28660 [Myxococcota bacterium]
MSSITITADAGEQIGVSINGTFTVTVVSSGTAAADAANLANALESNTNAMGLFFVSSVAANVITVQAITKGIGFTLLDISGGTGAALVAAVTANSSGETFNGGEAVTWAAGFGTIRKLSAITDPVVGFVAHKDYGRSYDTRPGVPVSSRHLWGPGDTVPLLTKGRIVVPYEGGTLAASRAAHIRAIANGGNTIIGATRADQDGVNTLALANSAIHDVDLGAGAALLEINLP